MVIAKIDHGEVRIVESFGEKIQLAAGMNEQRNLTDDTMERGLSCLKGFAQYTKNLPKNSLRIVGTNALREARNCTVFLQKAEEILGHSIEIISGREEARLIYLGVSHTIPSPQEKRLVIDIGGGSTEFIIGKNFEPLLRESLHMGCVSFTQQFFHNKKISQQNYKNAYTAACLELLNIEQSLLKLNWKHAIGSSGTIKAIASTIHSANLGQGEINLEGIAWLKQEIFKTEDIKDLTFSGIKANRVSILPAGLAILEAIIDTCQITQITFSEGALREGLLYDLVGRNKQEDIRERTLNALMTRYHIDKKQASRVEVKALEALEQVSESWNLQETWHKEALSWAARTHEIGLDIAHYQYQKHSAYLIEHSDLAGFSKRDQQILAFLVRSHRRNIPNDKLISFGKTGIHLLRLCILLRLAILFYHIRSTTNIPKVRIVAKENTFTCYFPDQWLDNNPLTKADFQRESNWLKKVDITFLAY
ncbi:UNVERIFIED_CONTAM: hypothetical protein GTU68_035392 [Idotea baltica]|nr:hypothetical protein [Idotea baltica]